jgi:hypothetical protein
MSWEIIHHRTNELGIIYQLICYLRYYLSTHLSCDVLSLNSFVLWGIISQLICYLRYYLSTHLSCEVLSLNSFVIWGIISQLICSVMYYLSTHLSCDVLSLNSFVIWCIISLQMSWDIIHHRTNELRDKTSKDKWVER